MRNLLLLAVATLILSACGGTSVFEMAIGDCFDDPSQFDEVSSLPTIDCAEPHDNEVFAMFDYTGSAVYPGVEVLQNAADNGCIASFEDYVGIDYFESEIYYSALWPSEGSWDDGDREIICFAYEGDLSKITGSLQGVAR